MCCCVFAHNRFCDSERLLYTGPKVAVALYISNNFSDLGEANIADCFVVSKCRPNVGKWHIASFSIALSSPDGGDTQIDLNTCGLTGYRSILDFSASCMIWKSAVYLSPLQIISSLINIEERGTDNWICRGALGRIKSEVTKRS